MPKGRTTSYHRTPIVMVFNTSTRKNGKKKMKVWKTRNIDEILDNSGPLSGVPDEAEILELAIGSRFIDKFKLKYKL